MSPIWLKPRADPPPRTKAMVSSSEAWITGPAASPPKTRRAAKTQMIADIFLVFMVSHPRTLRYHILRYVLILLLVWRFAISLLIFPVPVKLRRLGTDPRPAWLTLPLHSAT